MLGSIGSWQYTLVLDPVIQPIMPWVMIHSSDRSTKFRHNRPHAPQSSGSTAKGIHRGMCGSRMSLV